MSHRKAVVTEHYPVALQADKQTSEWESKTGVDIAVITVDRLILRIYEKPFKQLLETMGRYFERN